MKKKKAYEKPGITSEKSFEQAALQCTINVNTNLTTQMGCCQVKATGPRVAYS